MEWQAMRKTPTVPMTLIGLFLAAQAGHVAAQTPLQTRDQDLTERLERSEARAAALQQQLDALERRVQTLGAAPPAAAPSRPSTQAQTTPSGSPAQPPSSKNNRTASAHSAPGTFEVDEEAAQRALERTLTQSGALLLPTGTVEITPSFSYQRQESNTPALVAGTTSGTATLVNQQTRRSEYIASLGLRAGLPFATQLELDLPYNRVRSSIVSTGAETSNNGSGMGDVTLGVAKTLIHEGGWKPDLIGRLSYNFGNGKQQDNNVQLLGGYRQATAELVALKRQDPLAFVVSGFYSKAFEEDAIKPGAAGGLSLRAVLAASPATSLQLGFSQIRRQEQEFNGRKIPGSDQTYGLATFGASSVLARDLTLVTQFGIGLGNDAPKYSINLALPILFR